ncbi:restriction endonuclease subunit S (plasmid) [Escherichia coli]|uniref:restriction endonuclease subunit S n=1 Tax=Escherichia coli TaxID=562 RepID=UPI0013753C68|nr:restriction endonuclease subunit S [Escherichia coli]QHR48696.1 restriction endonuclease subunit S [Escherichia coli]
MERLALMPKYEDYVDSGVEWLGDLPSHWDAVKMKFLFKDTSMKNKPNETLLSVTQSQGVVPREWVENRMVMPSGNLESFKFIAKGDFAISLRSFEGGLEYCHHDGIISPAYTVLKTKKDYLLAGYYKYLFKSQTFISELQTSIVGIREGKNISYEELQYSLLPIPAEEEQTRIANFLDKKTALIDEAISLKEQQISLLKERKQIIIQQAVTQGLDPNVPMKDSGVDWIGDIPAHWGCTAVKRLLDIPITDGPHTTPQLHDEGIPFISAEAIKGGEINFDKKRGYINEKDYLLFSNKYTPKVNDIYMVKSGATTGRVAIVRTEMKFTIWSPLAVFRVDKNKLNPLYLYYFLQSYSFLKGVELSWSFGTQQNIGMGVLGNLFALAPPLEEQQLIVNSIEPHFREIDIASEQVYQQIEKLKEYKTTLINSAVTGKIKITPEMVEQ